MEAQQLGPSPTNPGRSIPSSLRATQATIDARIHADFEKSGTSFDYSTSVQFTNIPSAQIQHGSDMATTATYLQQIQKGKLIQPFGCLLALDEKTFKVIAYSENAPEMLTMVSHAVPTVGDQPRLGIGSDIRTIFTAPSAAALHKALGFGEVSLLNPVLVHCKTSGKPFYAIIHRVTGSLIIDFEPVKPYEVPITASGALQSYKLAAKAIARLQALPCGSLERLCETMAQAVFELTGYDRVMVYRFHDDDHGEVFVEITRPGLESYKGLHYPATDIPQAARFLFMKSKVRMICDCRATHVKVVQDVRLSSSLTLCGSTMRAPHTCHLRYMENMNSIASLVMAVVINEETDEQPSPSDHPDKKKRLWGLVVCHHTSPRFVPFPLRYACEFLSQVFSIHVSKELDILNQAVEKNILKTQTVLCDMLLRGNPLAIVTENPTVMDLVKCDGAVLHYKGHNHRLGLAPTDPQIRDILLWLDEYHRDSTGTSTDSLLDAGFPGAAALGDAICGMAAVRVTSRDWLFWFRSNTGAEVRWGGAKHEKGEEDDGRRMHPRSSFKAFMEVVKARSVPWRDFEMDAIHSLQLILRNACEKEEERKDVGDIQSKLNELDIDGAREMDAMTAEMVRLIETASVPILAVGVDGVVNGWNTKIADLTGLPVDEAIGQHLLALVEEASADAVSRMLESVLQGQEERNIQFEIKTHGPRAESGPISLVVNGSAARDVDHNIIGVCFIAQDVTTERSITDKFTRIKGDYLAIVQNPNPLIPPIFGSDEFGWCSEWNPAMSHLAGWQREEVTDKMLLGEVFGLGKACCRLKNQESYLNLGILLNKAMTGQDSGNLPFGFFSRDGKYVDCLLSVSKRVDREGAVTGLFCFLQLPSRELQQALHVQHVSEQTAMKRLRVMNYIRSEIKNPLSGIVFSRKLMEGTELDDEQKELLRTTLHCQRQLNKILDDTDLDHIIEGYLDLEMAEFKVVDVLIASVCQIMEKSNAKGIVIADEWAPCLDEEILYGDSVRLQQVLAAFLLVSVDSTPGGGQLGVAATLRKDSIGESVQLGHLQFRITHGGVGVPEAVIDQMFGDEPGMCEEGLSLFINHKLVKLMNGNVQYLREANRSTFTITVELAVSKKKAS